MPKKAACELKSSSRCWPGYAPVPGKPKNAQRSCQPKAKSKLNAKEKKFRAVRKQQLDPGRKLILTHPAKPRSISAPPNARLHNVQEALGEA
jgi:hypothetical protein